MSLNSYHDIINVVKKLSYIGEIRQKQIELTKVKKLWGIHSFPGTLKNAWILYYIDIALYDLSIKFALLNNNNIKAKELAVAKLQYLQQRYIDTKYDQSVRVLSDRLIKEVEIIITAAT
jgi:hypothetical protein